MEAHLQIGCFQCLSTFFGLNLDEFDCFLLIPSDWLYLFDQLVLASFFEAIVC